jgi:uncharacterized LabA/DUF88 family protein
VLPFLPRAGRHLSRPACQSSLRRTTEKGIDTAIVTDMMRLAWDDAFDVAVLVSADADFIPTVQMLHARGRMVIQASIAPSGRELARACWGSVDMTRAIAEIPRKDAA